MRVEFISVDLQNDFASPGGKNYIARPSVAFLKETLFPHLALHSLKINEIISDYRQPRPGDRGDSCHPGTSGYESIVPGELVKAQWIKSMNSPLWTRENAGDPTKEPGLPYQDVKGFSEWLAKNIGNPSEVTPVLIGLTIDCCVLSTGQELSWRGYYPKILVEGVDAYSGNMDDKEAALKIAENWSEAVSWTDLSAQLP